MRKKSFCRNLMQISLHSLPCVTLGFHVVTQGINWARVCKNAAMVVFLKCWSCKMIPVSPLHMNAVSAVSALYIQKCTVYLLYEVHHPYISPEFLLATLQVCKKKKIFLFRGLSSTLLNRMSCVSAGKTPPTSHWLSIPLRLFNRPSCQSDRQLGAENLHLCSLPPANQPPPASGCAQTSLLN